MENPIRSFTAILIILFLFSLVGAWVIYLASNIHTIENIEYSRCVSDNNKVTFIVANCKLGCDFEVRDTSWELIDTYTDTTPKSKVPILGTCKNLLKTKIDNEIGL